MSWDDVKNMPVWAKLAASIVTLVICSFGSGMTVATTVALDREKMNRQEKAIEKLEKEDEQIRQEMRALNTIMTRLDERSASTQRDIDRIMNHWGIRSGP